MARLTKVLDSCINNGEAVIKAIKDSSFTPDSVKKFDRVFNLAEAAKIIGVTPEGVRKAELAGKIKKSDFDEKSKRRIFTLKEINECREYFKTKPGRREGDSVPTIAFINFKGGVYKSTSSLHFSQYMALQGYKVLFVDADSQGTSTQFFGLTPDDSEEALETIGPFLSGEKSSLRDCIKKTAWHGLDLIPANLSLYEAELYIPILAAKGQLDKDFYYLLKQGLETVKDDYDLVVIDAPPALGIITMNIIYAADGLVIPTPPLFADFSSTLQFFSMLREVAGHLGEREFSFIKLLITKYDGSDEAKSFIKVIRHVFGSDLVLNSVFSNTAEIPRASQDLRTVYEVTNVKVKQTYMRAVGILDRVNRELELLVQSSWPSYAKDLIEEGVI